MKLKIKLLIVPIVSVISMFLIGVLIQIETRLQVKNIDEIYNVRVVSLTKLSHIQQVISDNHLRISNSIVMAIVGELEETINQINIKNEKSINSILSKIGKNIDILSQEEQTLIFFTLPSTSALITCKFG